VFGGLLLQVLKWRPPARSADNACCAVFGGLQLELLKMLVAQCLAARQPHLPIARSFMILEMRVGVDRALQQHPHISSTISDSGGVRTHALADWRLEPGWPALRCLGLCGRRADLNKSFSTTCDVARIAIGRRECSVELRLTCFFLRVGCAAGSGLQIRRSSSCPRWSRSCE